MKFISVCLALLLIVQGIASLEPSKPSKKFIEKASRVTFKLVSPNGSAGGTGFHAEWKGHTILVSNSHVCNLADSFGQMIAFKDNEKIKYIVSVLKQDPIADLCILTPIPGYKGISIAKKDSQLTDSVYSGGHPYLGPFTFKEGRVSFDLPIDLPTQSETEEECTKAQGKWLNINFGFFSQTFCMVEHKAVWTDLDVKPGCSGSAVLNSDGYVAGVVFAGGYDTGYYVPNRVLREFLTESESLIQQQ